MPRKEDIELTPHNNQDVLSTLADMTPYDREQLVMNSIVKDAIHGILSNVENANVKMKLHGLEITKPRDNRNIKDQQSTRNQNGTWADEVRADVEIIDKSTGESVDRAKVKVADIPKLTDRNTYIIGGNEYGFTTQARLKPGIYTRVQNNGEISSFFNVDKTVDFDRGFNNNFKINFEPESKTFKLTYGAKNIPLYAALRVLGRSDEQIKHDFGKEVFEANSGKYAKYLERDSQKFYQAVFGKVPGKDTDIAKEIQDRLFKTELDPETTMVTMGKPYRNVSAEAITDAVKKIIDIHKGVVKPDDRESLIFKSFAGAEDHIRESLVKNADRIRQNLVWKLDKTREIRKSLGSQNINPFTIGTIVNSKLSNPPSQVNVMSVLGDGSKLTIMGEGGVGSANAISNEARNISNTEAGFLDPLHTPEGGGIGIVNHFSNDTIRVGKDIYSLMKTKAGKNTIQRPIDVYNRYVAFPDEYERTASGAMKPVSKLVKVIHKGELIEVPHEKVDFIITEARGMFDYSANAIPFLSSLQGNRGLTASKMQEQALSLVHREEPLYKIRTANGKDLHEVYASVVGMPRASHDGTVHHIDENNISIKSSDGEVHKVGMYNNFSLNNEAFLHNEAAVKVGDTVKKGQRLADNNNTRNGRLSIGTNLNVAYVPFHGYNYEDSAVCSESAAKKLTSEHVYDFKARRSPSGAFSRAKYRAYYPEEVTKEQAGKLDEDGIIRVGERVEHGDTLIAHLEPTKASADDVAMGRLGKQLNRDMNSHAKKWESGHRGIVTSVEKKGRDVVVNVKTEEQLVVGDKISGLHGNKHIISKILPDDQMPYNPRTGEKIDLTMSPIGVTNRINTSQLLENAAGKLAKHTGKHYEIQNFSNEDNTRKLMADMAKAGIADKDILVDPSTGKPMKNMVANGVSHILKLEHKVDHKFSARYRDGHDSNMQAASGGETGGKNLGRMEIAALLARRGNANLNEMFNIKGQKNDEFWRAIETNQAPPPPAQSFVWDKMTAMLRGSGINVTQDGKTLGLKPMTDKDTLALSRGEILDPDLTYRKKDLAPMRNGLFDPKIAGGMQGEHYTHFTLPEKILNPAAEHSAAAILGLSNSGLQDIIAGRKFVSNEGKIVDSGTKGAISGGPAIEMMLGRVDVKHEIKTAQAEIDTVKDATKLNKLHRKLRYLQGIEKHEMKPTDYMIQNVPIIPAKFRPMFAMGPDQTVIMSDVNYLYQQAAQTKDAFNELHKEMKSVAGHDKDLMNVTMADVRGALYDDVKAITGYGDPTSFLNKQKGRKGFMSLIDGGDKQTKEGFFQDRVMERRQDLVGRSTIILNPELRSDQIGIPKPMATKIFQPFIMRKLVQWGYTPLEAKKQIEDKTPVFEKARLIVCEERPVIANRAPTLHRWNMIGLQPVLVEGKQIEMPPLILARNAGADVDGDSGLMTTVIRIKNGVFEAESANIGFGEDSERKDVDIDSMSKYIESYLKQRMVQMPGLDRIVAKTDSETYHFHISEFPRLENTKVVKENGNEEYDVPAGVSILTIDNVTHEYVEVPVTKFSVHKDLFNYNVETSSGDTLWLSADQSAIVLNNDTYELERVRPDQLSSRAIPKVVNAEIVPTLTSVDMHDFSISDKAIKCNGVMPLIEENGWLIGAMIGDGWVPNAGGRGQLCIATTFDGVAGQFSKSIDGLMSEPIATTVTGGKHDFDGFDSFSLKHTKSSQSLTNNFIEWIGKGAHNKHLPPFFMSSPLEFRLGLAAGLLDTDGTVTWQKKAGDKRQFCVTYSTMSDRLAEEMVTLFRSIGVTASLRFGKKIPSGVEKRVVVYTTTIYGKDIILRNENKKLALSEFYAEPQKESAISARLDMVPFSEQLLDICRKFIARKSYQPLLGNIMDAKRGPMLISRQAARKIIAADVDGLLPEKWKAIVANENVTWVYAKSVKLNPERIDMYDITAPGPYTFMCANGIIVQDTFQIHTPIGVKAQKEARDMMPSNSNLKVGWDSVMNMPDADILAGAWLASVGKGSNDKPVEFKSFHDIEVAIKDNKIDDGDMVKMGNHTARAGMFIINHALPEEARRYDIELTKKNTEDWLRDITHKYGDKAAVHTADMMKDVGNRHVTACGYSLGASDTVSASKIRDEEIRRADIESHGKGEAGLVKAYHEAKSRMGDRIKAEHGQHTALGIGMHSGASKGIDNILAITAMPGLVADANDNPIPMPIKESYSEGLSTFGYWAAAHGARAGNIKKSVSSFMPGWLTKDLINSMYATKIDSDKPVDTEGLEYGIEDSKGISGRYLARDVLDHKKHVIANANDLLDSNTIGLLKKSGVKSVHVQSPITDPTPGDGFSSYSYGVDYKGYRPKVGDDIGIMSAHTITEPSLNMAMKAFHTGGAFTGKKKGETQFDILDRTLRFTHHDADKAAVATGDGTVQHIRKSSIGGHNIDVKTALGEDKSYYVGPDLAIKVGHGDSVAKGQVLSGGDVSMHDVLKTRGMRETQKFLVNKLNELNEGKLDRRDIETIVRGCTNTTKIMKDPTGTYVPGDIAPWTHVEKLNSENGNKIKHEPFLMPMGIGNKAASQEDWIARLAHSRVRDAASDAAMQGWKSDLTGKHHSLPKLIAGGFDRDQY